MNKELFKNTTLDQLSGKNFLGIDYGEKVIGLATFKVNSDPFPLLRGRIITERSNPHLEIKKIVDDDFIDYIIFGIPYFTDGKESEMTQKMKSIGEKIADFIFPTPLIFQDETLTTYEAEERMKNDPRFNFKIDMKRIDEMSASIIIEEFLRDNFNKTF